MFITVKKLWFQTFMTENDVIDSRWSKMNSDNLIYKTAAHFIILDIKLPTLWSWISAKVENGKIWLWKQRLQIYLVLNILFQL